MGFRHCEPDADALDVYCPTIRLQQRRDPAISITAILLSQTDDRLDEGDLAQLQLHKCCIARVRKGSKSGFRQRLKRPELEYDRTPAFAGKAAVLRQLRTHALQCSCALYLGHRVDQSNGHGSVKGSYPSVWCRQ